MESTTASASYSLQKPEWLVFLCILCAFAEGSCELYDGIPYAAAAACVATILDDPQRRMAAMGGRDGMSRSLGSVYSGAVTRFLGGFRGGVSRVIAMPGLQPSLSNGVALSRDGTTLLVTRDAVHIFSVHTGAFLRTIGGFGRGPLQFSNPCQVWVASDGFVFVADNGNDRIQILTPQYVFHAFVGADAGHGRVTVFTLGGEFVRHVGVDDLDWTDSVACSDADELVVFNWKKGLKMFSASGEVVWRSDAGEFTGVAIHGSRIFGQTASGNCVVFS